MMLQSTRWPVIDFTSYIMEHTHHFTGRKWVFKAIDDWLADPKGGRFFLLVGEPGSGKTAIASRLAQFSQGTVYPPEGLTHLTPNFLSSVHFCSARDNRWINPRIFTESVSMQLAKCYQAFARALVEQGKNSQVHVEVQQHIEQGQGIGIIINRLDLGRVPPEDAFDHLVREPLENLLCQEEGVNLRVIILVDALDEALTYGENVNVVSLLAHLDNLPPQVRFILTSRQDMRVESGFLDAEDFPLSATKFDQHHQRDIRQYVRYRFSNDQELAEKAAQLEPIHISELVDTITRKAEGNFQYTRFLLDAIVRGQRSLTETEGLPEGLDGLYFESLQRVIKLGKGEWHREYAPVMGMLSVIQENPTLAQLQSFTGQSTSFILKYLDDLWQFIEQVKSLDDGETRFRFYHQSVIDFLQSPSLSLKKKTLHNSFCLPVEEWHQALSDWCEKGGLVTIWEDVKLRPAEQGRREYARRHYISHLYLARKWQRLFDVLDAGQYGQAKIRYDLSTYSYAQDLDLGRQAATWNQWKLEESISLLPYLWRYTLLRCSLASRAERYSPGVFQALLIKGRGKEALGLVELLANPYHKFEVLLQIAKHLGEQRNWDAESVRLLVRACDIAYTIEEGFVKDRYLEKLLKLLIQAQQWEQAEAVTRTISTRERDEALRELAQALIQAQQWERAEAIAAMIAGGKVKVEVFSELGKALTQAYQWERADIAWNEARAISRTIEDWQTRVQALSNFGKVLSLAHQGTQAEALWTEAEAVARAIQDKWKRDRSLSELAQALIQVQQWERAEAIAAMIAGGEVKVEVFSELGKALTQAYQWERADIVWETAEAAACEIEDEQERVDTLSHLGAAMIQAQQWGRVDAVVSLIDEEIWWQRIDLLQDLGSALAQAQQWERLEMVIHAIEEEWQRISALKPREILRSRKQTCDKVLKELAKALIQAQQWERVEIIAQIINNIVVDNNKDLLLSELTRALILGQQWKRAESVACMIEKEDSKARILSELGKGLAEAQQWEQAEALARRVEQDNARAIILGELGTALALAQQWERARALWSEAEAVVHCIQEESRKAQTLEILGTALAQVQQWKQAYVFWNESWMIAQKIKDISQRSWTLYGLARALIQTQRWRDAETVALAIGDSLWRGSALDSLIKTLIQAQQWEQAEALAIRNNKLDQLKKALIQAQQWEHAEALVRLVKGNDNRIRELYGLAEEFTKTQQWDRVLAIWVKAEILVPLTEKESNARARVLKEVAKVLIQIQHWEQAEQVIHAIENDNVQAEILSHLAQALAQAQSWEYAETVARSIGRESVRTQTLKEIAQALIQAQQWDRAETLAHTTEKDDIQTIVLSQQIKALAQVQQWEQAEAVARTILTRERDEALKELVLALAQAQQWKRAEIVSRTIEDARERVTALCELAKLLAKAQHWERANAAWNEAEMLISTIERRWRSAGALCELVESLISGQQWERAEALAHTIQETSMKVKALSTLGEILIQTQEWERLNVLSQNIEHYSIGDEIQANLAQSLARAQQWERAEAQIYTIEKSEIRIKALSNLAMMLARAQQQERAEVLWVELEVMARAIQKDGEIKTEALGSLVDALIQTQQWERAETIIQIMGKNSIREKMLDQLARALAQVQRWEQAIAVAHMIEYGKRAAETLSKLVKVLAQAHRWEQAEALAHIIDDPEARASAFKEITEVLATTGGYERLLRVIQHSWMLAHKREYLAELLPLANGFISLKPEIGIAFSQAFAWVDTFSPVTAFNEPVHLSDVTGEPDIPDASLSTLQQKKDSEFRSSESHLASGKNADGAMASSTPFLCGRVLSLAQEESRRFQHNYVGPEHLLLGLIREDEGIAAKVLMNLGAELNKLRSAVEFVIGRGNCIIQSERELTLGAKKVIGLAGDEARRLNHPYIGTEHLLLGLIREGENIAVGVLEALGISLEQIRIQTVQLLEHT